MNLIMVFEQRAPLGHQDAHQWRRLLQLGVETLEDKMDVRLLAANFWRDGFKDINSSE